MRVAIYIQPINWFFLFTACLHPNYGTPTTLACVKAKQVHDICKDAGIPVWVGSMLESGVGEAYNLHFATLDNCKFPADVAPSDRYFVNDIIEPLTEIVKDGTIEVPQVSGMGFGIDEDKLKKHTT